MAALRTRSRKVYGHCAPRTQHGVCHPQWPPRLAWSLTHAGSLRHEVQSCCAATTALDSAPSPSSTLSMGLLVLASTQGLLRLSGLGATSTCAWCRDAEQVRLEAVRQRMTAARASWGHQMCARSTASGASRQRQMRPPTMALRAAHAVIVQPVAALGRRHTSRFSRVVASAAVQCGEGGGDRLPPRGC